MSRLHRFVLTVGRRPLGRTILVVAATGVFAVTALSAAACGTSEGTGGQTTSSVPPSESIVHPTGPDDLVLQVSVGGGFVPVEYNLTSLPEFSLYGDGRVIVTGPVMAIYPGPALPNLQVATISTEAVQSILTAAKEAGLFRNDVDYGELAVTDVGTTTIVVNAEETTYLTEIYGLGMEEGAGAGLSLNQLEARGAIDDLRSKLIDLSAFASGEELSWSAYEFDALAVFSRAIDPDVVTDETEIQPNTLAWPLDDLATMGEEVSGGFRRTVVTGDGLATLRPLLQEATMITEWTSGEASYNLYFRPLLPHEKD